MKISMIFNSIKIFIRSIKLVFTIQKYIIEVEELSNRVTELQKNDERILDYISKLNSKLHLDTTFNLTEIEGLKEQITHLEKQVNAKIDLLREYQFKPATLLNSTKQKNQSKNIKVRDSNK